MVLNVHDGITTVVILIELSSGQFFPDNSMLMWFKSFLKDVFLPCKPVCVMVWSYVLCSTGS